MKKLLISVTLLLSLNTYAYKMTIKGNKKTQTSYIKWAANKCLEKEQGIYHKEKFNQCLFNEQIFASVRSELVDEQILITIKDKWTLIPVPNYKSDGADKAYGIFAMDRNFLGLKKLIVIGTSASNRGNTYALFYRDPYLMQSNYSLMLNASKSRDELTLRSGSKSLYSIEEEALDFGLSGGHQFTDKIEVSIGAAYTEKEYNMMDGYDPQKSYYATTGILNISYNKTHYKLFFNEGIRSRAEFKYDLANNHTNNRYSCKITMNYQKVIFEEQILQLNIFHQKEFDTEFYLTGKYGGRIGARGVKNNAIWSDRMTNLALDYQFKLKDYESGVITTAPFLDFGTYHPLDSRVEYDNYLAYGLGFYFFIKKVDLPAMGLQMGHNEKHMGDFVSFYIGIGR